MTTSMLELASACLCHRPTTSLWICYQQFGTPFMLTGLSSPDKYSKFRPFAAPRWTLTEGPRITLAPLPCVWHGLQRRFESLNHCSQPKFGPWNSGFLQIDSTLNSVPMAAATNPIRSSSHVEAKPSMPVVSKKHATRREKTKKSTDFLSFQHGKAVVVPPVLGWVARNPCAASCIFKGGIFSLQWKGWYKSMYPKNTRPVCRLEMEPENDFFKGSTLLGGGVFSTSHVLKLPWPEGPWNSRNVAHIIAFIWWARHGKMITCHTKGANIDVASESGDYLYQVGDLHKLHDGASSRTCVIKRSNFIHAFKKTPASIHPFQSSEKSINLWPCKLSNHIFCFLLGLEVSTCFNKLTVHGERWTSPKRIFL